MNVVLLSGRLTKDVNASNNGKMANVNLAVDRPYPFGKDRDGNNVSDFLMLKFIGENAVNRATRYLHKGIKINVRGIVCRDSKQESDGTWTEYNYVIVNDWEFCESKAATDQNQSPVTHNGNSGNSATRRTQQQTAPKSADDDFMDIDDSSDDLIPFA